MPPPKVREIMSVSIGVEEGDQGSGAELYGYIQGYSHCMPYGKTRPEPLPVGPLISPLVSSTVPFECRLLPLHPG